MNTALAPALGRRKNAVATARLKPGTGKITVNGRPVEHYFTVQLQREDALRPLSVCSVEGSFDVSVVAKGGGISGQAGAVRLAIARALVAMNPELKLALRPAGLVTRDPRMVERKKYGQKKARKRFQFSKR